MLRTFVFVCVAIFALVNASSLRGGRELTERQLSAFDNVCSQFDFSLEDWLEMAQLMGIDATTATTMWDACQGTANDEDRDEVWIHNCHGKTAVMSWKAIQISLYNSTNIGCESLDDCGGYPCFWDKNGSSCNPDLYDGKPECGTPKGTNPTIRP